MLTGIMCALSFLVWFLLQRMNREPAAKHPGQGHFIDMTDERRSWRDWENTP